MPFETASHPLAFQTKLQNNSSTTTVALTGLWFCAIERNYLISTQMFFPTRNANQNTMYAYITLGIKTFNLFNKQ